MRHNRKTCMRLSSILVQFFYKFLNYGMGQ